MNSPVGAHSTLMGPHVQIASAASPDQAWAAAARQQKAAAGDLGSTSSTAAGGISSTEQGDAPTAAVPQVGVLVEGVAGRCTGACLSGESPCWRVQDLVAAPASGVSGQTPGFGQCWSRRPGVFSCKTEAVSIPALADALLVRVQEAGYSTVSRGLHMLPGKAQLAPCPALHACLSTRVL